MLYFYLRALHIEPVYEGYERKARNNKRGKNGRKKKKNLHRSEKVEKTRKKAFITKRKERKGSYYSYSNPHMYLFSFNKCNPFQKK
jgi:hypothetical protein